MNEPPYTIMELAYAYQHVTELDINPHALLDETEDELRRNNQLTLDMQNMLAVLRGHASLAGWETNWD